MNLLCFKGYLIDTWLLLILQYRHGCSVHTMVTELARGIRPSLIQGCFHSSTGNLISFYPTTNRHFVLQAGDGALGCPSYQFCALPPITGLQLLVRKPQGLFHILCIGYDAWQQYVQALRPPHQYRTSRWIDLMIYWTWGNRATDSAIGVLVSFRYSDYDCIQKCYLDNSVGQDVANQPLR